MNRIFRKRGDTWQELPGRAIDIQAGEDGSVWILGKNNVPYKWNEKKYEWIAVSGQGQKITIHQDGSPIISNKNDEVFIWKNESWAQLPGRAGDIASGNGYLFAVGNSGTPFMWSESDNDWVELSGTAKKIAVGGGNIFLLTDGNEILKGKIPS